MPERISPIRKKETSIEYKENRGSENIFQGK
jgi:hypothetical protein